MKRFFIGVFLIGITSTLYTMDQQEEYKKEKVTDGQEGLNLLIYFSNNGALNRYQQEGLNDIIKLLQEVEIVSSEKGAYINWKPRGVSVNKKLEQSYFIKQRENT